MPKARKARRTTPESEDERVSVYERLFRMNAGFDAVLQNLRALRKHASLRREQVRRFEELAVETRAAANSYLLETFATQETEEAGRLFRMRFARERQDDEG